VSSLLVRNLDDDIVRRLKERARTHGRSVEAEHRAILEEALGRPMGTDEWIDRVKRGPLSEVADDIWKTILAREDTGRSFDRS
jgi:hypothetical protein